MVYGTSEKQKPERRMWVSSAGEQQLYNVIPSQSPSNRQVQDYIWAYTLWGTPVGSTEQIRNMRFLGLFSALLNT